MDIIAKAKSGSEIRRLARTGKFSAQTAGQAPNYLQGNIVILPLKSASDFLQFCLNNPKPCPLIGLAKPGDPGLPLLGTDIDIRTDVPLYHVFKNGVLFEHVKDILDYWSDDLVTFVLGCSFTFEDALMQAGFGVPHIEQGKNAAMFKTNIETIPGGVFKGPLVVSMRPYPKEYIPKIFDLCSQYPQAHGAPIYWGNPGKIGIMDLQSPDYGDVIDVRDYEIPVFWACGVTPQATIKTAKPDLCITHAPGHMLITDISSDEPPETITAMSNFQIQ